MAFDHDARVQIDGRQRAIEYLDEVRKRLERERNEARHFYANEHKDRISAEAARDALHIALTELVRLHDLKLGDDAAWELATEALQVEHRLSLEPCVVQLTDSIFCQLPQGHTGAHQYKWGVRLRCGATPA